MKAQEINQTRNPQMQSNIAVYAILVIIVTMFFCKQAVYKDSTFTDTPPAKDNHSESACCDTVVFEKDTTAIDVKECEIAPEILKAAKPIYSMEMIDNNVEGTVKLKLLVGSDGSVKEYIILNNLGHGTNKAIHNAIEKMEFTAARKNKKRVSVWIETTLYFKLPKI